jgi:hypothetical protein
VDYFISVLCF